MVFKYKSGALTSDTEIPNVTQELDSECTRFYGYRYFICESITLNGAKKIAKLMGCQLIEEGN